MSQQVEPSRVSRLRIGVLLAAGAVLVYLSTWVGPLSFYTSFQSELEARDRSGILWRLPEVEAFSENEAWTFREEAGLLLPLPPGEVEKIEKVDTAEKEGTTFFVKLKQGEVYYNILPRGFFSKAYSDERYQVGLQALADSQKVPSDREAVESVLAETPGRFRFSWSADQRAEYSARILSKMLLWEDAPIRRLAICRHPDGNDVSVLAEYETGDTKVIVAGERGCMVVKLPKEAPAGWKASPANWFPGLQKP